MTKKNFKTIGLFLLGVLAFIAIIHLIVILGTAYYLFLTTINDPFWTPVLQASAAIIGVFGFLIVFITLLASDY